MAKRKSALPPAEHSFVAIAIAQRESRLTVKAIADDGCPSPPELQLIAVVVQQ